MFWSIVSSQINWLKQLFWRSATSLNAGSNIDVGNLTFEPPRDGPTLWEIGIPNRTAAEFYVPDPNPMYINKLYVNHPDRLRWSNLSLLILLGNSNILAKHMNWRYTLFIYDCLGRYRQYGLWERYADLYPDKDLVYTVGVSDYRKDWFYAQVTR